MAHQDAFPGSNWQETPESIMSDEMEPSTEYKGFRMNFPPSASDPQELMEFFLTGGLLHYTYMLKLFRSVTDLVRNESSVLYVRPEEVIVADRHPNTQPISRQVIVVGDLHGSFGDLMHIMTTNPAPSEDLHYIFNGVWPVPP